MSFLGETKRRKVFQVAAVYVVVAWLLVQVITSIEEPLNLPTWTDTLVIVLLAIGFPITLIMGWAFDLTSRGIVRTLSTDDLESKPTEADVDASQDGAKINRDVIPNSVVLPPV